MIFGSLVIELGHQYIYIYTARECIATKGYARLNSVDNAASSSDSTGKRETLQKDFLQAVCAWVVA